MAITAVIGSGFSGLSAACYLSRAGHEVHVFEKNSSAGGRARQITTPDGFVFDMGPSWYWMPGVFEALADVTADARWSQASSLAVQLIQELTRDGEQLPPDWAVLTETSAVPAPIPDLSSPIQYGPDAQRLPIWLALACQPDARSTSARWWMNILSREGRSSSLALSLDGQPINAAVNAVSLLAGEAAAQSAGEDQAASSLRGAAIAQARNVPSYYGDAWLALIEALSTGEVTTCQSASRISGAQQVSLQ